MRRLDPLHVAGVGARVLAIALVVVPVLVVASAVAASRVFAEAAELRIPVLLSWGHVSPAGTRFTVTVVAEDAAQAEIVGPEALQLEPGDGPRGGSSPGAGDGSGDGSSARALETIAGGGDVDGVTFAVRCPRLDVKTLDKLHPIWADLIAASDEDTARRLREDPAYRIDPRRIGVRLDREGTRGFSVTVDQLLRNRALWVPALDVYVVWGEPAPTFAEHRRALEPLRGRRILERVEAEPEASYEAFAALWEDMGTPSYRHPSQPEPGHIVCLTWDSAVPKFGVDRGGGIWNDYGNPDRFRLWLRFPDRPIVGSTAPPSGRPRAAGPDGDADDREGPEPSPPWLLGTAWKGQRLADGLPVITTTVERGGARYEIEAFAYPLLGPPRERRGDIAMVLLQRVRVTDLDGRARRVDLGLLHRRERFAGEAWRVADDAAGGFTVEAASGAVLVSVRGETVEVRLAAGSDRPRPAPAKEGAPDPTREAVVSVDLPAGGSRDVFVCLPSPAAAPPDRGKLLALDFNAARAATVAFWSDLIARGARFHVGEKVVDDLFRASLWHALRLPRRHGGSEPGVRIDLPYSNFAYDQNGTPWPVNQAVYVDSMIHDLRGYHDISVEELLAMYASCQKPDGRVAGYAEWGVYTPSMIWASARSFLLSGDRAAFDRLLPPTLRALDWCLGEVRKAADRGGPGRGLIRAPLNDGTGDGVWAFNQAYFHAGIRILGKALGRVGHPRAGECAEVARAFGEAVEREFGAASALSPLVQLRDHTWSPYVPCDATSPRRLLDAWYPTDVDTGAVHLLRLGALPARGTLADALLHDHEDNLFIRGWGAANEPVYNQQATAYLFRDEAKAAIRAFYSMLACAFSHCALEPVEHRWTWGQYFGPPSTDGAWFDLYRNLLVRELDDDGLILMQAAPRRWLEDGKAIEVERAPTFFGALDFRCESRAAEGRISVAVKMPGREAPARLVVRIRHPQARTIRAVTVNGADWTAFDPAQEWVEIRGPREPRYEVVARY